MLKQLPSIILILCLGIIVYSNSFFCSFHFDDVVSIIGNHLIRDIQNLQDIWNYIPRRFILFFSFAVNYHFHQLDVFGYHLFNLAVHLGSSILVWWLVLLTLSTPAMKDNKISQHTNLIALLVGLVFVSHPIQTQAVTYIVQRAASMATLFYLASLSLYVQSRLLQDNPLTLGKGRWCYIFSLIIAIMAMFTKEMAISLPLMILFYEVTFIKTKKSLNWKYLTPFLLTVLIIPATTYFTDSIKVQEIRGVVIEGPTETTATHYLLTQFRVMITYIRLAFLPLNQNLDYDYSLSKSIFELFTIVSLGLLLGILFFAKRIFSKYRLVSFSIFWFFLTLLPESSLFPIKDVIFEHRLYLPLVGYSLFLVSGAYYLLGQNTLKKMVIFLMLIITCYSVLTYQRNKVWKNDLTLWDDVVHQSPHKARVYISRGNAYLEQGQLSQAIEDYNKAIEISPEYAEAYNKRGFAYTKQGHFAQAVLDYTKAIKIFPQYIPPYEHLGALYVSQGEYPEAISIYTQALAINPKLAMIYTNRGVIYAQQNNLTQALLDYDKAIQTNPKYAEAYYNRAVTYYQLEKYDRAWEDVHKAKGLGMAVNLEFIKILKRVS